MEKLNGKVLINNFFVSTNKIFFNNFLFKIGYKI